MLPLFANDTITVQHDYLLFGDCGAMRTSRPTAEGFFVGCSAIADIAPTGFAIVDARKLTPNFWEQLREGLLSRSLVFCLARGGLRGEMSEFSRSLSF